MTHSVLVPSLDEGDINPKVLQLIGSEKIQVRKRVLGLQQEPLYLRMGYTLYKCLEYS
jgi:hypothetical protein